MIAGPGARQSSPGIERWFNQGHNGPFVGRKELDRSHADLFNGIHFLSVASSAE